MSSSAHPPSQGPPSAPTEGWSEGRPWTDGTHVDPELDAQVEATLAARWDAMASYAETVAQSPSQTILPSKKLRTTAGERAMAAVRLAETPAERLEMRDEVLGVGGMSVVRRGKQMALDREVAVKELPEKSREMKHAALELLQEAWVTGRLEHPNVVPIYDLALDSEGRPRLVMKRIEGVRWTELMRDPDTVRERFGVSDVLAWHLGLFMQVCHAIHFAHERGVIHRDIKPDNVMVGAFGEVYVLDWGIAVTTGDSSVLPSHEAASMAGTPPYMAPEMISGGTITVRTDVYLLGGLLYELVTGQPPHHGKSLREIAKKVLVSNPSYPEDAPSELVAVIRRALSRNPAARYEDAEALRRAIQQLLEQREARALTHAALGDLQRLEVLADSADEDERTELYDVFGACRFGFRAALNRFEDDAEARAGLARATQRMVELELARENAQGAAALLAEMDDPPAGLVERVERARAETDARQRKLERIAFHHDRRIGTRPRWMVLWLLTVIWVGMPVWHHVSDLALSWTSELVRPLIYGVLLLILLGMRRRELVANRFNRQLWAGAMAVFAAECVFTLGQMIAGMDVETAAVQDHAIRGMGVAALAIFVEPVLWFGAVAFFANYLIATVWPEYRYLAASVANLTLMLPLLWRWRPSRLERPRPAADSPS